MDPIKANTHISVRENLTAQNALSIQAQFKQGLRNLDDFGSVTIDLSAVRSIDSVGLSVLVGAVKQVQFAGGHVIVLVSDGDVHRTLRFTRLSEMAALTCNQDSMLWE